MTDSARISQTTSVKLLPAFVVDWLPDKWWRPGNLHRVRWFEVHCCDEDHVKSIELNGRIAAQGRKQFPYDIQDD